MYGSFLPSDQNCFLLSCLIKLNIYLRIGHNSVRYVNVCNIFPDVFTEKKTLKKVFRLGDISTYRSHGPASGETEVKKSPVSVGPPVQAGSPSDADVPFKDLKEK